MERNIIPMTMFILLFCFIQMNTTNAVTVISSRPTSAPTIKPTRPTMQPISSPPTMPMTCSQIASCSSASVVCPVLGYNYLTEGKGAIGTYYYVLHGNFPVVYNASAKISPTDLNNGTGTTTCTQDYSRALDDDGVKDCDAGHILANQLGGIGSQPINIFPQDLHINRGAYRSFETRIYNCISTTGAVANLQWHFIYQNDTETKPTSVIYNATFSSGSCAPGFSTVLTNCYTACSVTGTSSAPTIQPNSQIVSSSPSLTTPSSSGPQSSPTATPSTSNNDGNSSSRITVSCLLGQYSTNNSSCVPCSSGQYKQTLNASSACVPCGAGSYTSGPIGASSCTPCPAGRYSASGSTACQLCPPGQHTPAPGYAACLHCSPGKGTVSSIWSGATSCESCPAQTAISNYTFCQ